jgi:hypothetical protein
MLRSAALVGLATALSAADGGTRIPADFALKFSRGGCEGACPTFEVSVDGKGRVRWRGQEFVHLKQTASRTIPPAEVRSLLQHSRRLRILSLPPGSHLSYLDRPLVTVALTESGRSISVAYCDGDPSEEARRLSEFARIAERVMADAAWIGTSVDRRMR